MLASNRAAAHIVVDRGILNIIFNHYILINLTKIVEAKSALWDSQGSYVNECT